MHIETNGKDLTALLDLYNKEIDTLKSRLLNGVPWEELSVTRRNITELAIAIHKMHRKLNDEMDMMKKFGEDNVTQ